MNESENSRDPIIKIMELLQDESPDISNLCDLVYHYNKSLGLTYTTIRQEIGDLNTKERFVALQNFLKVIDELKSPNLFIQIDELG